MKFTEHQLREYAAPLSETEDNQCLHAISMVRDALKEFGFTDDGYPITKLYEDTYAYSIEMRHSTVGRRVKLFVQGSYANNTNVRTQSDVDIAVIQEDVFLTEYRSSASGYPQSDADYNFSSVEAPPERFKDEVQRYLVKKFGQDVERKNKSIKIHGNTYRKDADAVPCRRYRDYRKDFVKDARNYVGGVVIYPDEGGMIINYPEQHIANGRKKNNDTRHYYKKMVRIIKKMRYLMSDYGYSCADKVSSFGLESSLWNLPDETFLQHDLYGLAFGEVVDYLYGHRNQFANYKEANGIKRLCQTGEDVQNYQTFVEALSRFFDYGG